MKKFVFLAGVALGFVIGSRTGRGPYESLERTARQVADDPEVHRRAAQARDTAGKVAHDAAESVKDRAPDVASGVQGAATAAKDRVAGNGGGDDAPAVAPASTAAGDGEMSEDDPLSS